jgi:hypothetical protein
VASVNFSTDRLSAVTASVGRVEGVDTGVISGFPLVADYWNGVPNDGEFGVPVIVGPTSCPSVMSLGGLGRGVAAADEATGEGWIMWSASSVHSRFSPNQHNADHLIAVRFAGGQWYVDNNGSYEAFTPASTDCLVASVNFSTDRVTLLQGARSSQNGIDAGYSAGDLDVQANSWDGKFNVGEFGVAGSTLSI